MEPTVYLLGAGASRNALPLAADFENSLRTFRGQYEGAGDSYAGASLAGQKADEYQRNKQEFFAAAEWGAEIAREYGSLDTYANERFFQGDRANVRKIKSVISAYFVAEQAQKPVDPRYRMFFTEVLDRSNTQKPAIPSSMKIVTWNYDTQLEAAYYRFCNNDEMVLTNITGNDEQIFRLNGYCAGAINVGHGDEFTAPWKARGAAALPLAYGLYHDFMDPQKNLDIFLFFAWEHDKEAAFLRRLPRALSEATNLVMIGYSMPLLNKDIDKLVFGAMSKLRKVDYQVGPDQEDEIWEKLQKMLPKLPAQNIVARKNLKKFYVPY